MSGVERDEYDWRGAIFHLSLREASSRGDPHIMPSHDSQQLLRFVNRMEKDLDTANARIKELERKRDWLVDHRNECRNCEHYAVTGGCHGRDVDKQCNCADRETWLAAAQEAVGE